MDTLQLSHFLTKEVFGDFPVEKSEPIYSILFETFPLHRIKNKKQHSFALAVLTRLSEFLETLKKISFHEKKQILDYMDALGLLVEEYEKKTFVSNFDNISGADMLEFLMEQHSLKQIDLTKELGGQSIVSEILSHKRRLGSHQILALSKRFGVSPSAFFP